ncbi:MAG: hypothetical protein V2B18_21470 [Pseudomonadota bacterium]
MNRSKERSIGKPEAELSEYQRLIIATDNVMLCVALAEKTVNEMGRSLAQDFDIKEFEAKRARKRRLPPNWMIRTQEGRVTARRTRCPGC